MPVVGEDDSPNVHGAGVLHDSGSGVISVGVTTRNESPVDNEICVDTGTKSVPRLSWTGIRWN